MECAACERLELPDSVQHYRSTSIFDESTVPKGLRGDQETTVGVGGVYEFWKARSTTTCPRHLFNTSAWWRVNTLSLHQKLRTQWRRLGTVSFCVEFLRDNKSRAL